MFPLSPVPIFFFDFPVPALAGPNARSFDGAVLDGSVPDHRAVCRAVCLCVEADRGAFNGGLVRSIPEPERAATHREEPSVAKNHGVFVARLFTFFSRLGDERLSVEETCGRSGAW